MKTTVAVPTRSLNMWLFPLKDGKPVAGNRWWLHYCPKSNSAVTDRRGVESSCGACGAKSGPPPRGDS